MLWRGWGERKRQRAGHDGKGKERGRVPSAEERGFVKRTSAWPIPPRSIHFGKNVERKTIQIAKILRF